MVEMLGHTAGRACLVIGILVIVVSFCAAMMWRWSMKLQLDWDMKRLFLMQWPRLLSGLGVIALLFGIVGAVGQIAEMVARDAGRRPRFESAVDVFLPQVGRLHNVHVAVDDLEAVFGHEDYSESAGAGLGNSGAPLKATSAIRAIRDRKAPRRSRGRSFFSKPRASEPSLSR